MKLPPLEEPVEGLKPPTGVLPKLGLKPEDEDAVEVKREGVKPDAAGVDFVGSIGALSAFCGVKRPDPADEDEDLVPLMALANMFDVDVAVGCRLGVGAEG